MVPLATVVGAPKLLDALPPLTLFREDATNVPFPMVVFPAYVFGPESVKVATPAFVKKLVASVPLIAPLMVRLVLAVLVVTVETPVASVQAPLQLTGARVEDTKIKLLAARVCMALVIANGAVASPPPKTP